jgi:hypothetical protein
MNVSHTGWTPGASPVEPEGEAAEADEPPAVARTAPVRPGAPPSPVDAHTAAPGGKLAGAEPAVVPYDEARLKAGQITFRDVPGTLFVNGVSADDVSQGGLGDCWLMSAMAAVAQRAPERIQSLFQQNGDGTYSVHLHDVTPKGTDGRDDVKIDAKLPVGPRIDEPASGPAGLIYGSSTEKSEEWPALLEKAVAAKEGGYGKIGDGGTVQHALETLTGVRSVTQTVNPLDPEGTWNFLKTQTDRGNPLAATTPMNPNTCKFGILPDHGYTVLGIEEKDGKRFVELRNPITRMFYIDRMPDGQPGVAEEKKLWAQMVAAMKSAGRGPQDIKLGAFEMPYDQFVACFGGVVASPIHG